MTIAMQPIYTQTVGAGGVALITFNNIPQTFTDLFIETSARSLNTGVQNLRFKFNNDSTSLYSNTNFYGDGSTAGSDRTSGSAIFIGDYASGTIPSSSNTANTFSNQAYYLPNYTGSNFKSVIQDSVSENNAASTNIRTSLGAGLYRSTSAISRIDVSETSGSGFAQYSTFTLYGITKG